MRRNPVITLFLLIALVVGTAWGFAVVLGQRFRTGEGYSMFSTQRSDPLGAKALFEALDRVPEIKCERNLRTLEKLEGGKGKTLVLLNLSAWDLVRRQLSGDFIQKFAASGGRVIITMDGQQNSFMEEMEKGEREAARLRRAKERGVRDKKDTKPKDEAGPEHRKDEDPVKDDDDEEEEAAEKEAKKSGLPVPKRPSSMARVFGVRMQLKSYKEGAKSGSDLDWRGSVPLEAEELPKWHTNSWFEFVGWNAASKKFDPREKDDKWIVHATKNDHPMIVERPVGSGSIVLLSDSYFASNEALFKEPKPAFLAWLIGHSDTVIFDETHLGTGETPGIMTLVRRYRLHGMFIGALVLFALFIWRNTMSLVPAQPEPEPTDAVAGHGATAGLISLLRRGIPRGELLSRCLDVWLKSNPPRNAQTASRLDHAKDILSTESLKSRWQRNSPAAYTRICEVIHPPRR